VVLGERFLKPRVAIGLKAIVAHSIVQTKIVKQKETVAMKTRLDGIDSQALEVLASLVRPNGLHNLGMLPPNILQDIVEQPKQLAKLRTMCFWDSIVGILNLQTFSQLNPQEKLSAKLSGVEGIIIEPIASSIVDKSPALSNPKNVIFCLCSVFQLTGRESGASINQIIEAVEGVCVGNLHGREAPVELLWEIACNPRLTIEVSTYTYPVMKPVEYESGKFGLLWVCWQPYGVVISPKYDYQADIAGHKKVMFILENDE